MVFKLQVILLIMEGSESQTVGNTQLAIWIDSQVNQNAVAMENVAE